MSNNLRLAVSIFILSGAVVAGHFLPGLDNSEIQNGIRNALHIIVFAAFAVILFELLQNLGAPKAFIATLFITGIVGGLAEFLQYSVGRQPDINDLVRDIAGAALAICSRILWRRSQTNDKSNATHNAIRVLSVVAAFVVVTPLLYWLTVINLNRSAFPTILDFDNWWERHLYYPVNAEINEAGIFAGLGIKADTAIEIKLSRKGRSGLAILPMVSDWTDFKYLTFVAAMVNGPDTVVTVRINDGIREGQYSDHFVSKIVVTDQPMLIRIPFEELISEPERPDMDLSDIQEIIIFARDKRKNSVMMLAKIHLE